MNQFLLYVMSAGYVFAGIMHFIFPKPYKKIMPPWLPYPLALVYVSGACEIVFGSILIPEITRPIGAWLIIVMLIAIFPANIQMAINLRKKNNLWFWISIARLPLQILLIWWAWVYTR